MIYFTAVYFLMLLFISCIPVSSNESRGRRRSHHGLKVRTESVYRNVKNNLLNSDQHQKHWQRQRRKLTSEEIEKVAPITREYGSADDFRQRKSTNGMMSRGKGSSKSNGKGKGSKSNGKGSSKGKGKGKGENTGKGGNDSILPNICYNSHGTEGKMGKGSKSVPKAKAKRNKSMNKSSKGKTRKLKGTMGKEKSEKIKKGKGNKKHERCSKFESGQTMKQRMLYDSYPSSYASLLDTARDIPEISVFVSLLYRFDLSYILECDGPFTALIPTNDAFNRLDPIVFADLLLPTSRDKVEQLILNHVFPDLRTDEDFMEGSILSLSGKDINVGVNPLTFNNDATAVTPNIFGSNGVLHLIDRVLLVNDEPTCDFGEFDFEGMTGGQNCMINVLEVACSEPELSIFLTLIEAANLQSIFTCSGPFTVLAPTNEAFNGLSIDVDDISAISDILLYHVLPGLHFVESIVAGNLETLLPGRSITVTIDPVRFDNATVLETNSDGCNGIVHILDSVLTPGNVLPGIPSNTPVVAPVASIRPSLTPILSSISPSPSSIMPFMLETMLPSESGPNVPTMLPNKSSPSTPTVLPISIPSANTPSTAPIVIPSSDPNTAIPSLAATALPISVPNATIPIMAPVALPPIVPTAAPTASPNGTFLPSGTTIQPTIVAQTLMPSVTTVTFIPSDLPSLTPSKAANSPTGTSPVSPTNSPIVSPNGNIPPSGPTVQPTVGTESPLPSAISNTVMPSDLPSLTPSKATSLPIGTSPVSSTPPTPPSPNTNQPAILPSAITVLPSTLMAPTATNTPTQSPSSTLNTTSPTSMGSDIPSLMPQSNTAAPIVTMAPTALTVSPTASPTASELSVDLNETFYIAFISESTIEPTADEYEQMRAAIEEYYNGLIGTMLNTTDPSLEFIRIEMYLNSTQPNAGIPDDRFNIYMEYSTAIAFFDRNSTGNLITSDDLLDLLLDGITTEFLIDPVRMQSGTPFAEVTEVFIQTLP